MESAIAWVIENKEWLFSGLAVTLMSSILGVIYHKKQAKKSQKIRAGKNSTNYQAGRDIQISSTSESDNEGNR